MMITQQLDKCSLVSMMITQQLDRCSLVSMMITQQFEQVFSCFYDDNTAIGTCVLLFL